MNNLIPHFVQKNFQAGKEYGIFEGGAIFLDIAGFTAMTTQLMELGKHGAEILSEIVNSLFTPLIQIVYHRGGFVCGFAGDAFTAIFPNATPSPSSDASSELLLQAAREMQLVFQEKGVFTTERATFRLSVKIGIAKGEIEWGILNHPQLSLFFFRGEAVENCTIAEKYSQGGDIILDQKAAALFSANFSMEPLEKGYHRLEQSQLEQSHRENEENRENKESKQNEENRGGDIVFPEISREVALRFMPQLLLDYQHSGEFRDVASAFISIQGNPDMQELKEITASVLAKSWQFGGYFNSLDFGDKGCTIFIIFGAPIAYEDNYIRAANFCLQLIAALGEKARIGLSYGTVFSGIIGSQLRSAYTALGDVINLSARIMMQTSFGSTWLPASLARQLEKQYLLKSEGLRSFKGIDKPVELFSLVATGHRSFSQFQEVDFVGRQTEMEHIEINFKRIRKGEFGGVIYCYGEAGSGKSRLLHEIYQRHRHDCEFHFMHTESILHKSMQPFISYFTEYFHKESEEDQESKEGKENKGDQESKEDKDNEEDKEGKEGAAGKESKKDREDKRRKNFFDRAFENLLQQTASSNHPSKDSIISELKRTHSLLAALVGLLYKGSLYESLTAEGRFENTIDALRAFFLSRSILKPTVIVLENLHWIDKDSQKTMEKLIKKIVKFPLLILISSRYADSGEKPHFDLENDILTHEEIIDQLPKEAAQKLIELRLKGRPTEALLDFIQERTRYNAFFIEQFCFYLLENNMLEKANGLWKMKFTVDSIPQSINAIVLARIDRLSGKLREAVQTAAVIGNYFNIRVLSSILQMRDQKLDLLLQEGIGEQIWEPVSEDEYNFKSILLRQAAYDLQLQDRLKNLHHRAAERMEHLFRQEQLYYLDIAYHYEKAQDIKKTRQYYYQAAQYAEESYKISQALESYNKLIQYSPEMEEQLPLLDKKARFLNLAGSWEEAVLFLEKSIAKYEKSQDANGVLSLQVRLGELLQLRGDSERAVGLLTEVLQRSEEEKNRVVHGFGFRILGRANWSLGRYHDAIQYFQKALILENKIENSINIALNLYYTGVVYRDLGDYEKAIDHYQKAHKIFSEQSHKLYITYPLYDLAVLQLYRGKLANAGKYFRNVEGIYGEIGYRSGLSASRLNLGVISAYQGNFKEALLLCNDALKIAQEVGEQMAIAYTLFVLGRINYDKANYRAAIDLFERSFVIMKKGRMFGYYGYIYSYLICILAGTDRLQAALKAAVINLKGIEKLGGSDVENGRSLLGVALALKKLQQKNGAVSADLEKLLQELALLTTLAAEPKDYFQAAIEKARTANYMATLVPALYEYGVYLYEEDQIEEAQVNLNEALQKAKASEMAYYAEGIATFYADMPRLAKK